MMKVHVALLLLIILSILFMILCYGFFYLRPASTYGDVTPIKSTSLTPSHPREILNSGRGRCMYDLYARYKLPLKSEVSWEWCEKKRVKHSVQPGYSFGSLSDIDRAMWERGDCNSLLFQVRKPLALRSTHGNFSVHG